MQKRFDAPSLGRCVFCGFARRGLDAPAGEDASDEAEEQRSVTENAPRRCWKILTHFEERHEEFQLAEALLEHDEYFSLWRSHHIKMVERMVGTKRGTGGSEGVGYLQTTLDKKFFPELWEARTHLDTKHGETGCPFTGEAAKPAAAPPAEDKARKAPPKPVTKSKRVPTNERRRAPQGQSESARTLGRRSRSARGRSDELKQERLLCA